MNKIVCRFLHWCLLMLEDPREELRQSGAWRLTAPDSMPKATTLAQNGSRVLVGIGGAVFLYDLDKGTMEMPPPGAFKPTWTS